MKGSWVALVTPFAQDGSVDLDCLRRLIKWQIEEGTDGVVLCGTTGESPTLSWEEKLRIFTVGVQTAEGAVPIMAGVGSYSTEQSVAQVEAVKQIGVDAALVIVPYYNRPTPEGCFLHYQALSHIGLPLLVYHHPGRTGVKLSALDLLKICELPSVLGVKEASGDLELAIEFLSNSSKVLLCGDDLLTLPLMACGASGVISVVANLIPREWKLLTQALLEQNLELARTLFFRNHALCKAMTLETNPQCVKYALSCMGKCLPFMRLPLILPAEGTRERIRTILNHIELLLENPRILESKIDSSTLGRSLP